MQKAAGYVNVTHLSPKIRKTKQQRTTRGVVRIDLATDHSTMFHCRVVRVIILLHVLDVGYYLITYTKLAESQGAALITPIRSSSFGF